MKTVPALVGLLGVLVIIGSLGTWVSIGLITVTGVNGGDGRITLALGAVACALVIVSWTARARWAEFGATVVLMIAGVLGVWEWNHLRQIRDGATSDALNAHYPSVAAALRVGWGLELVTIAGLTSSMLLLVWMFQSDREAGDTDESDDAIDNEDVVEGVATLEEVPARARGLTPGGDAASVVGVPKSPAVATGLGGTDRSDELSDNEDRVGGSATIEGAQAGELTPGGDVPAAMNWFRNPKVWIPAWIAMIAVAGTAAGVWWVVLRDGSPSITHVTGELVLTPAAGAVDLTSNDGRVGSECEGAGPYSDVRAGMQAVVTANGKTLAVASFGPGVVSGLARCTFRFALDVPTGYDFYTVTLGRRGQTTYSRSQFEAPGTLQYQLGN